MTELGSQQNPLRVAVVGSGPSGFYATEALLRADIEVHVDLLERLPAPYGLVRNGVAPDHPKLKNAIKTYHKIAQMDRFALLGNVAVGVDVSIEELQKTHHAVVVTCGAETDRRLGIPGEDLPGSHTATEFVGWYNGHPDFRDREFDLSGEIAVIIGQGNVAADVSRILSKTVDELKHTDISAHALDVLAESNIKEIRVVGRRGPAQAKFTSKELKEFGELEDCHPVVAGTDLALNPESEAELADKSNGGNARNFEIFQRYAGLETSVKSRQCFFEFLKSPVELQGTNRIEQVVLEANQLTGDAFAQAARGSGERYAQPCQILFRSIGYHGVPLAGLPFDEKRGIIPNNSGRITGADEAPLAGLYTAGWIKRGPTGIIGTNRADAVETVAMLLADLAALPQGERPGTGALRELLSSRNVRFVDYPDWERIDAAEIARGEPKGKPREKFTHVAEMLEVVG